MNVYLIVFDKSAFSVSKQLLGNVESYIDENYVSEHQRYRSRLLDIEKRNLCDKDISFNAAPMEAVKSESAKGFGISADRAADYVPDGEGTALNFKMMSEAVAEFRECGAVPQASLDAIRKDMKNRGKKRK